MPTNRQKEKRENEETFRRTISNLILITPSIGRKLFLFIHNVKLRGQAITKKLFYGLETSSKPWQREITLYSNTFTSHFFTSQLEQLSLAVSLDVLNTKLQTHPTFATQQILIFFRTEHIFSRQNLATLE